jgi:hypothetical protein
MVDILLSSDDLSVFGGPASIDVNVDIGAQGVRGSYIFTGPGKPTDPDVEFPLEIKPFDLYINLKPSDLEYLFLYQYGNINGVLQWSRVLRLIPNTALANIPVIFYNGEAVTFVAQPGVLESIGLSGPEDINLTTIIPSPVAPSTPENGTLWLDVSAGATGPWPLKIYNSLISTWVLIGTVTPGLSFPIGDYFTFSELGTLSSENFNIQYVILNETPIASGLTLGELTEIGSKVYLPVYIKASQTQTDLLTWEKITGIRTLSFVVTANIGNLSLDSEES